MELRLSRRAQKWILVVILLLALGLRLFQLGQDPFWLDEVRQHAAAAPLDYFLLRLWRSLSGAESAFALRLPYAIYGVISVALCYVLGRRLFDRGTGLLAAYILALSKFHVSYSQELRFYSLSALLGILSVLVFERARQRHDGPSWALWGLVCLLGLYTHFFLGFLFGLQWLWLFWDRSPPDRWRSIRPASLALGLALLAFTPWLRSSAMPPLDFSAIRIASLLPSLAAYLKALGPALGLLIFAPLGLFKRKKARGLLVLVFLPFAGAYLADLLSAYFFHPRQLIFTLPLVALLSAASISTLAQRLRAEAEQRPRRMRRWLLPAGGLLWLVFTAANAYQLWRYYAA